MRLGALLSTGRARAEPPKVADSTAGASYYFGRGITTAGEIVTPTRAAQLAAVYSCIRLLSESIAGLPLGLFMDDEKNTEQSVRALDHPLWSILHDEPNPEMTAFNFREVMMVHLLLWGNAYAQIIRNGKGEVIGLYPLMADRMRVDRDENGKIVYIYRHGSDEADTMDGSYVYLSPREVFHVPGMGFDGLVGYSPIEMARNTLGVGIACEKYGASFFGNGASPGAVLEHPGTLKDPGKVRDAWNAAFRGANNGNKIAVLEEGMKYQPISIPPEQAQFLETRKFQIAEIARIYRVPPHMIGDMEHSTFSNIEHQSLEFVKYTLTPWVCRWEQAIKRLLLTPEEKKRYYSRFNVDGLLRGDYLSRMNGYAVARQNGWMSANDIRGLENLSPIPEEEGGNLYLINGNMTKLKDAGLFAGQAAQTSEESSEETSEQNRRSRR